MTKTAPKPAKNASGVPKKPRGGATGKKTRGPSKIQKLATAAIKEAVFKFDGSFTREQTKGLGQTFLITMRNEQRMQVLRLKADGSLPRLTLKPEQVWMLFVSHA